MIAGCFIPGMPFLLRSLGWTAMGGCILVGGALCQGREKSALGTLCSEQNLSSGGGASPLQMLKIAAS